jgi:SAM-dependent methyltransferase
MVFDRPYADCYDLFYRYKNYESECDTLEEIFSKRGMTPSTIIDLGCGTARHAVLLAQRGYSVTGVDRSEEMLQIASDRIKEAGCEVALLQQEIQDLRVDSRFDVAVAMFAVIGYLWTNEILMDGFQQVFAHLEPGGLFIFDCWHGPAVAVHRPQQRFQRFSDADGAEVVRLVTPHTDASRQIVDVEYETLVITDGSVISRAGETHRMRYFHPMELRLALETCGFRDVEIGVFGQPERTPSEDDWNIVVSSRRPLENGGAAGFSSGYAEERPTETG